MLSSVCLTFYKVPHGIVQLVSLSTDYMHLINLDCFNEGCFFFFFFEREEHTGAGKGQRERKKESLAGLCTVQGSYSGLNLTTMRS